jgi:hypothetical protein
LEEGVTRKELDKIKARKVLKDKAEGTIPSRIGVGFDLSV